MSPIVNSLRGNIPAKLLKRTNITADDCFPLPIISRKGGGSVARSNVTVLCTEGCRSRLCFETFLVGFFRWKGVW